MLTSSDFLRILLPNLKQVIVTELSSGTCNFYFVRIVLNSKESYAVVGSGTDKSLKIAVAKAISEGIECLYLDSIKKIEESRSGWAVHVHPEKAKSAALCEIVERDAFLVALYSDNYRSRPLDCNSISIEFGQACQMAELQSYNQTIRVVLCCIEDDVIGSILGLGTVYAGEPIVTAQVKALSECLMIKNSWTRLPTSKVGLKSSLLVRHASAARCSTKISQRITHILKGDLNMHLSSCDPCALLTKEYIIESQQVGSRFLTRVGIENALELKFGTSWSKQEQQFRAILKSRGMSLEYFEDHPLL